MNGPKACSSKLKRFRGTLQMKSKRTVLTLVWLLLSACTSGGGSPSAANNTNTQTSGGTTDPISQSNTCVAGSLVAGCTYPAPSNYPYPQYMNHPFGCSGPTSDGSDFYVSVVNDNGGVCVLFSAIVGSLQGNYASFGVDYFNTYPLNVGPLCATQVMFEGQIVNACF